MGFAEEFLRGVQIGTQQRAAREQAMRDTEELKLRAQAHKLAAQQYTLESQLKARAATQQGVEAQATQNAPTRAPGFNPDGTEQAGPPAPIPQAPVAIPGINAIVGGEGTGVPEATTSVPGYSVQPRSLQDVLAQQRAEEDAKIQAQSEAAVNTARQVSTIPNRPEPNLNLTPEQAKAIGAPAGEISQPALNAIVQSNAARLSYAAAAERSKRTGTPIKVTIDGKDALFIPDQGLVLLPEGAKFAKTGSDSRNLQTIQDQNGNLLLLNKTDNTTTPVTGPDGEPLRKRIPIAEFAKLNTASAAYGAIDRLQEALNRYTEASVLSPAEKALALKNLETVVTAQSIIFGKQVFEEKGVFTEPDRTAYKQIQVPNIAITTLFPEEAQKYVDRLKGVINNAASNRAKEFKASYGFVPPEFTPAAQKAAASGKPAPESPQNDLRKKYNY